MKKSEPKAGRKPSLPANVKSLRTVVILKTLLSMRKSATTPDNTENNQAPRYGRLDRKLFCRDKELFHQSIKC